MKIETLGEELDKTGAILTIKRTENLCHSPAYTFYVRQMIELIENKHTYNSVIWKDDECGIIWAEEKDKICGIFCYNKSYIKTYKILAIQLTAVGKEFRQRGIHTILNNYFEQTARELGCVITVASVNPKNTVRLESCKKDGLDLTSLTMFKQVSPDTSNLINNNLQLEIIHNEQIEYSPAYKLFLKIHTDLIDEGKRHAVTNWVDQCSEILYCIVNEKIIGFINYFNFSKEQQLIVLDICYVVPEYRNQGIFKTMLESLEVRCVNTNVKMLTSEITNKDQDLEKIFKSVGFKLGFFSLTKKV